MKAFFFLSFLSNFNIFRLGDTSSCPNGDDASFRWARSSQDHPPSFSPYISMQDTVDKQTLYKRGHLKPFGYHRPPDRIVETLPFMLAPEDFHEHFVSKHRPVIFKGAVNHWEAARLWTDEYLSTHYGDEKMMMETKDDDKEHPPAPRPMREFLDSYWRSNLYMVDEVLPAMRHNVTIPMCLHCEEMTDRFFVSYFWMSNGGTASKIHIDTDENLLCVIHGSKTLLFVSPLQSDDLYADDAGTLGVSPIDPTRVDLNAFPKAMNVRYELAFVDAGDLVYIPQFWWHHVISHSGRQQAVALWWKSYPTARLDGFPPLRNEHGPFSYVDVLVYYEQWVLNASADTPRLECAAQAMRMGDYKWETDLVAGAESTKEYGYDEEDGREKDENSENDEFLRGCMFNVSNSVSPCFLWECKKDEDDPVCVRYILDYCHEVEDKGCAIELPQVMTKKTALYIYDVQTTARRWGQKDIAHPESESQNENAD